MSITTTYDVFCDICPMWVEGSLISIQKARDNARRLGWKYVCLNKRDGTEFIYDRHGRVYGDVCPACQKKLD